MPLGAFRSGHSLGRMVAIFGKRPTNLLRACNQVVNDKGRSHQQPKFPFPKGEGRGCKHG
jgi:hypothetical protein